MALLTVTFGDLEGHVCCFVSHTSGNRACIIHDMYTHEPEIAGGL